MKTLASSAMIVFAATVFSFGSTSETVIDIGSDGEGFRRAYGWKYNNERSGDETFCWILGREADLEIELPGAGTIEVEIRARPFYYGNCRQSFALFVNDRYVDEWICRHDRSWVFHSYRALVPAEYLRPGANTFTFRMAYESQHRPRGYSLAVERLVLRNAPEEVHGGWMPSAALGGGLGVSILFLVILIFRRM